MVMWRAWRLPDDRRLLTLVLLAAFIWSLASVDWSSAGINRGGSGALRQVLAAAFPPELSPGFLRLSLAAAWQTITFAVTSLSLAVVIGLPLGVLASGTLVSKSRHARLLIVGTRLFLAVTRSIHELIWGLLFVAAFGPDSLSGILAIAIAYGGILGRIYAERLVDVPEEPLRALRASGASPLAVLIYGRIPMAFSDLLSYTFYRFECAIRAAAILGLMGIEGLGFQIKLSVHDLLFSQVWTLTLFLVALVVLVDLWGSKVRRSLAA